MYYLNNKRHKLPHIHVKYQEQEAVLRIPGVIFLKVSSGMDKLRLVLAWIEIHKDELMADWELATKGEKVFQIEPLQVIMNPRVKNVKAEDNYFIRLWFSNGEIKIFDMKPYLRSGLFSELKEKSVFYSVKPLMDQYNE